MEESVFFNRGDSIASSYDYNEALRSAEIFKKKNEHNPLMLVRHKDGKEYAVFYTSDLKETQENHEHYYVEKKFD